MKVRLIGILQEDLYPPQSASTQIASDSNPPQRQIVARMCSLDGEPYSYLTVPAEMVRGAEIGGEFTVYLEPVKK